MDFLCCCQAKTIIIKKNLSFHTFFSNEQMVFSASFGLVMKFNEQSSHRTLAYVMCVWMTRTICSISQIRSQNAITLEYDLEISKPKQIMICKNGNIVTNQLDIVFRYQGVSSIRPREKTNIVFAMLKYQPHKAAFVSADLCLLFTVYILHRCICAL